MHIIYVDDEMPAIDNFRLTVANFPEIKELTTFQSGEAALEYVKSSTVDAAFLDMEMPGIHGLGLARAIRQHDPNIRIVFVTAFGQYALDAFGVDATGYLLKPYTVADIRKELAKCAYRRLPSHRVVIETMPSLSITVDGVPLSLSGSKPREMLALLVDRGERGLSMNEAIACLWPERSDDAATQSLYRMTWKRLSDTLDASGAGNILVKADKRRFLKADEVECDLYRILGGDRQAAQKYAGSYLQEYSWAEDRNAQLHWMLHGSFPEPSE